MKDYPPPPPPKKKEAFNHYLHHYLGMLPLLWCFFAHLLFLDYPDHHQNVISSSLYYPGPLHKISSQSVHNFVSIVVHRQTDRQTNQRYQKHNLLCQGGNNYREPWQYVTNFTKLTLTSTSFFCKQYGGPFVGLKLLHSTFFNTGNALLKTRLRLRIKSYV